VLCGAVRCGACWVVFVWSGWSGWSQRQRPPLASPSVQPTPPSHAHAHAHTPHPSIRPCMDPWTQWRALVAKGVEWIWVVRRILSLPEVASLFLADSLVYFVIKGLADWSVLALTETKGLPEKDAVGVFFYCELGAIAGSFASGAYVRTNMCGRGCGCGCGLGCEVVGR
jgi:hypothetical protein